MKKLEGRVAVVTGGGRDIGRAIALRLASEGATIVVSSRTEAVIAQVVAQAKVLGGKSWWWWTRWSAIPPASR